MELNPNNITLQINISPGDVKYASLSVPEIVSKHPSIKERLLIVDCCRPQKTKLVDPDKRFPKDIFDKNVETIKDIAKMLLVANIVSRVYYLFKDDEIIDVLAQKYLGGAYHTTHSSGGTANMSYWAGIELAKTQYVLHYDGDILLYQKEGYDWALIAADLLYKNENAIIAVPRLCPPVPNLDAPSLNEGRPFSSDKDYWVNDWFSTRHFLIDKHKLQRFLPLPTFKIRLELLLRWVTRRAFPIDPEILMFRSIGRRGGKRLILKSQNVWITHPVIKNEAFVEHLPKIIGLVNQNQYPKGQIGKEDMVLEDWLNFISS